MKTQPPCVYSTRALQGVIYRGTNDLIKTKCKSTLADSLMYPMKWNNLIPNSSMMGIHLGDK